MGTSKSVREQKLNAAHANHVSADDKNGEGTDSEKKKKGGEIKRGANYN